MSRYDTTPRPYTNGMAVFKEQVTGLSPALLSRTVTVNANGVAITETAAFDPATHAVMTTTANSLQSTPTVQLSKFGYVMGTQTLNRRAENTFDGFARIASQTTGTQDGFTNAVLNIVYDNCGMAVTNRTVYGTEAVVAATAYDSQGRSVTKTDALGNTVSTGYDALNQVVSQSGATYPVEYDHNTYGRRVSMKTFRDGNGAGDETIWLYNGATGLLTNKVYADNSRIQCGYTADGKLLSRRWARGVAMTNSYDNLGQITEIDYSGTMFDVFHTYDVFGYTVASSNSFASYEYRNSLSEIATNEIVTIGTNTCTLTRSLDSSNRPAGLTVDGSETAYGFDTENRFISVGHPDAAAEYRYSNGLVAGYTLTMTNGNVVDRFVGRDMYRQELVTTVSNTFNGTFVSQSGYGHDLLGRREKRTDATAVYSVTNTFGYNQRSEVTDAVLESDNYAYGYDSIGNRLFSAANTVTNAYAANALNQYTNLAYDADGNLTSGCGNALTWDCENRLQIVTPVNATNGSLKVVNRYDHRHRRVMKQVFELSGYSPQTGNPPDPGSGNPGEWNLLRTHTYFYDGWNLVLETVAYTNGTADRIEYVWGLDLSGTMRGAGGVGGLLFEKRNGQVFIPFYDANGNVIAYLDAVGNLRAEYIYNAFGGTVAQSGDMADTFAFRFSTKYYDVDNGLYYYGRRFYSSELGRWLNRDPIEEGGGANLYGFIGNNPVNVIDPLGLKEFNMTFDFTNPSEYNWFRRNIYESWDKIFVRETAEIIRKIKSTLNSKTCDCIKTLNISAHGSGAGNIVLGDNWYMSSQNKLLEKDDTSLGGRQLAIKRQMEQMVTFLSTLGTYICKKSTVTFVICGAGDGDEGSALRNQLLRVFPAGTKVVLFPGSCGFVYGIPTAQNGDPGKTGR